MHPHKTVAVKERLPIAGLSAKQFEIDGSKPAKDYNITIVRLLLKLFGSARRPKKEARKMTLEQRLQAMER